MERLKLLKFFNVKHMCNVFLRRNQGSNVLKVKKNIIINQ
jgi:hypothetical protein